LKAPAHWTARILRAHPRLIMSAQDARGPMTVLRMSNFYFHCTATYAILRQCGVEIGKRDFLGGV